MDGILGALLLAAAKSGGAKLGEALIGLAEQLVARAHPEWEQDLRAAIKGGVEAARTFFHTDEKWVRVELPPGAKDHAPIYSQPVSEK